MSYTPVRNDLGHDAQPDYVLGAELVGPAVVAIAHKISPTPDRWSIGGWRYIGRESWVDVDSDGIAYATGRVYAPA